MSAHDSDEDFDEGTDPDDVELDPDAPPLDQYLAGHDAEQSFRQPPALRFGLGKVVAVAVAFAVLGFGIGFLVGSRDDRPAAVDVGFTRDMIDHHDQAVQMAVISLAKPDADPNVRSFATEVLIFQRWEIGIMDTFLAQWGTPRGDPDRTTMQWMNMGTPLSSMPGIASAAQMAELQAATGRRADQLFLTMMREHHRGGSHMSDYAAEHGRDKRVRTLATRMGRNQAIEVNEYTMLLQRLGLER